MTDTVGLSVGETAPDLAAPLVRPDGGVAEVPLSDLVAEKPVLLSFYTSDVSPGCIKEWCAFRDFDWFATGERVRVVGVGKAGTWLHRQFIDRLGLGFPLYSDRDLAITEAFDVRYRSMKVLPRPRRSCFLLDADLTVRYRWVADHWLEPARDQPPLKEIRAAIDDVLGEPDTETFGFA